MTDDITFRIALHSEVTLPDWLEFDDPPRSEVERLLALHRTMRDGLEDCVRLLEDVLIYGDR